MNIYELSPHYLSSNIVTFYIDGHPITFDTQYPHDRHYISKLLFDIKIPQVDIDSALFNTFIKNGDRVLDAGANIGFTAIECIKSGAAFVLAVEPVTEIFARLSNTCRDWQITPLQTAIADGTGVVDMVLSQTHNQGATINEKMLHIFPQIFGEELEVIQVATTTLDQLVKQYGVFDVWKLDIEGAEVEALKGANEALSKSPPRVIIVEIFDIYLQDFINAISPSHPHGVRAFLRKNDYCLELTEVRVFNEQKYEITSPMYVFSQDDLSHLKVTQ